MRKTWAVLFFAITVVCLHGAERGLSKPKAAEAKPVAAKQEPQTASAKVRWYGHAFFYVTSSAGVRVALDPFGRETIQSLFPSRLPADLVLVSNEAEDHAAAERLCGNPQVFRSITAIGSNRASGLIFKGVEVYRDSRRGMTANKCAAFVFELDGVKFAHLGVIGDTLDTRQKEEIGKVDVVFLPVGNLEVRVSDLNRIAEQLEAKIIVPMAYKTVASGGMELRSLDDYLKEQKNDVTRIDGLEFSINRNSLPLKPTVYVLNTP